MWEKCKCRYTAVFGIDARCHYNYSIFYRNNNNFCGIRRNAMRTNARICMEKSLMCSMCVCIFEYALLNAHPTGSGLMEHAQPVSHWKPSRIETSFKFDCFVIFHLGHIRRNDAAKMSNKWIDVSDFGNRKKNTLDSHTRSRYICASSHHSEGKEFVRRVNLLIIWS